MSRAYDAKKRTLAVYPDNKEDGVSFFLDFINMSSEDFEYEFSETPEFYIYGSAETKQENK